MLRHRSNQYPFRLQHACDLTQDCDIVRNVFDHVERADEVDCPDNAAVTRIHLDQFDRSTMTTIRDGKAAAVQVAPGDQGVRQGLSQGIEGKAGATADFEDTPGIGGIALDQPLDQFIARNEPEMACLDFCEKIEAFELKSFGFLIECRLEADDALYLPRSIPTCPTFPVGRPQTLRILDRGGRTARW